MVILDNLGIGLVGPITLPKVKEMVAEEDALSKLEKKLLSEAKEEKEETLGDKHLEDLAEEESEETKETNTDDISYGFTNADRFAQTDYAQGPQTQTSANNSFSTEVESNVYKQNFDNEAYQASNTTSNSAAMSHGQAENTVHTMMTEYVMSNGSQNLRDVSAADRESFSNWLKDPFNSRVLLHLYQNTGAIQSRNVDYH